MVEISNMPNPHLFIYIKECKKCGCELRAKASEIKYCFNNSTMFGFYCPNCKNSIYIENNELPNYIKYFINEDYLNG